jgi:hypothetical protein
MSRIQNMPADLIKWVRDRCAIVDECWVWKLSCSYNDPAGRYMGKVISVRRVVFNATRKNPLTRKLTVIGTCGTEHCVHPDHIAAKSIAAIQRGVKKRNGPNIARAMRARAKLTPEAIEDIRSMRESSKDAAKRYGICKDHVNVIRRHEVWKDYTSPFAGLFAANDNQRRAA